MKKLIYSLIALLSLVSVSCSDSDEPGNGGNGNKKYVLTVICNMPKEAQDEAAKTLKDATVTTKDVNTGKVVDTRFETIEGYFTLELNPGLYDITLSAILEQQISGQIIKSKVSGYKQAIQVTSSKVSADLPLFFEENQDNKAGKGFVLSELFFTGTKNPYGGQYYADKYFVIYNNSNETLYADSLAIAESAFMTVSKSDYTPDIMSEAMAVDALYMIPGDGKTYPVKPGESLLICDNAINHKKANTNSFDLTTADFEWADESTNPSVSDVNNPDVPDMKKIFCKTKTVWSPHNRGFKAIALVKMKTDLETYLADYGYFYSYMVIGATGQLPMTGSSYKIPNSWVVDAVNLSIESLFQWIVVDPSLDRGWTYCGHINYDESRYGKCVRRKVESRKADGTAILKDTNNSTVDFDAEQTADPFFKF